MWIDDEEMQCLEVRWESEAAKGLKYDSAVILAMLQDLREVMVPTEVPSIADLLQEAQFEPERRQMRRYKACIEELRRKGFSFREIAEWLTGHGVDADHNSVYRAWKGDE